MKHFSLLFAVFQLFYLNVINAQAPVFTRDDTLRGSITPERAWWDLTFYNLKVSVDPAEKSLTGSNEIHYRVLKTNTILQVDLQPPLLIERVEQDGQALTFNRVGRNAWHVVLKKEQRPGAQEHITVWYSGKPLVAKHAPWDGGFS
ncbi:MAG: M1 family peptidase, partial [Lewinellaceae bacterium]|nr:M1 family peptidase [Lewinellaceae bacterium]